MKLPLQQQIIKRHNYSLAFTLIELLVVIAIIGILAGLLLTNLVGLRERAADTKKKNDLNQLKTALRMYYNDYQRYPAASSTKISGCDDGTEVCQTVDGKADFIANDVVYMKQYPASEVKYYQNASDTDTFLLKINLKNKADPDIAKNKAKCCPTEGGLYQTQCGSLPDGDYVLCQD